MTVIPRRAADFHGQSDALAAATAAEMIGVRGIGGLPSGCALLVVTRGPNAGSQFSLNQPVTTVGRHPNSDIFLDEITVSRRHGEF